MISLVTMLTGRTAEPEAVPVTVVNVEKGPLDKILELAGTVTAERRSSLSARTDGLVTSVQVDAGSRVREGDLLLELDVVLASLALERSKQALREARSELAESQRLFEEGQKLVESGGIPTTEAEARRAALRTQEAAVSQLEIDVRERAEVVSRHRLLAPFSGVISAKMTEDGEWVETGTPVLELVEIDAVRFDTQAPQERYAELDSETPVTVRFDSAPEREFCSILLTKVPVKDPVSRTFLVRLAVDAPSDVMVPGVSGRARFRIRKDANALTVPRDAIVRQPDGRATAWVVKEESGYLKARRHSVRIGGRMSESVEVLEGLAEGQRVVLRGNETLRDGQTVRILREEKAD